MAEEEFPAWQVAETAEDMLMMDPSKPTFDVFVKEEETVTQVMLIADQGESMLFTGLAKNYSDALDQAKRKLVLSYAGNREMTPLEVIKGAFSLIQENPFVQKYRLPSQGNGGSSVFCEKQGALMLVQEHPDKPYTLPGGKKEGLETHEQAIYREWREEVGTVAKCKFKMFSQFNAVFEINEASLMKALGSDKIEMCSLSSMPLNVFPWVYRVLYAMRNGREWPIFVQSCLNLYEKRRRKVGPVEGPLCVSGEVVFYPRYLQEEQVEQLRVTPGFLYRTTLGRSRKFKYRTVEEIQKKAKYQVELKTKPVKDLEWRTESEWLKEEEELELINDE